jgi:hypothetical protein
MSAGANPTNFRPILLSCMRKCLPLLVWTTPISIVFCFKSNYLDIVKVEVALGLIVECCHLAMFLVSLSVSKKILSG